MQEANYKVISMKSIAKKMNDFTFTDYFYRLMLLSRSLFKWTGLPDGMDESWIENYLFAEGSCVFFKDKMKGYMVASYGEVGKPNYYDEPTKVRPIATDYIDAPTLENRKDCVIIKNNDLKLPTSPTIQLFAWRLADITRTIDVNVNAMKSPFIIRCTDKQKMTLKQVYNKVNDNEPMLMVDKGIETSADILEVLKTDAPIVFDKLQLQKHAIWNECMTFLGVNNANQDKKERLVDDEVQANNQQVELSAHVMLKSREFACKQINEMFGTNIKVEMRNLKEEFEQLEKSTEQEPPKKEGGENDN